MPVSRQTATPLSEAVKALSALVDKDDAVVDELRRRQRELLTEMQRAQQGGEIADQDIGSEITSLEGQRSDIARGVQVAIGRLALELAEVNSQIEKKTVSAEPPSPAMTSPVTSRIDTAASASVISETPVQPTPATVPSTPPTTETPVVSTTVPPILRDEIVLRRKMAIGVVAGFIVAIFTSNRVVGSYHGFSHAIFWIAWVMALALLGYLVPTKYRATAGTLGGVVIAIYTSTWMFTSFHGLSHFVFRAIWIVVLAVFGHLMGQAFPRQRWTFQRR